ncbi:MAG: TonB-dependent receptor [Opitutus sp.]
MSKSFRGAFIITACATLSSLIAQQTPGATESIVTLDRFVVEDKTDDPAGVLPKAPISSIFGGSKSILETPRAVSVVSTEMLQQYGVDNIEGLAAIVPSSYTTSSFGIAGSLDLRGTSGENYFRGMKRIENGGVYPTPIGATDRIDVVRGPPSPVYGPGKIGGYLNFIPKSSRASTGKYLDHDTGKMTVTAGSWSKRTATLEQGGALGFLGNRNAGYYIYTMFENSGSYYRNAGNEQALLQSSFEVDLNDSWRLEFGQQYHEWASIEISGINRLTQDYIDHGTYLSGKPLYNVDVNGDNVITPAEFSAAGGITRSFAYGTPAATVLAGLGKAYALDPATVKTVQLNGSDILSDLGDFANARSAIYFADFINDRNPDAILKNQTIVDTIKRKKDTTQGFATMASGIVIENKTTFEGKMDPRAWLHLNNSASVSARYFDGENRSFVSTQPFDRRDLAAPANANNRILSPLKSPGTVAWNANRDSEHKDYGFGVLSDATFGEKFNVIVGGRVDYLDLWARADPGSTNDGAVTGIFKTTGVANTETGFSWMTSVSYKITPSIIPYATYSKQQSMQIGNIGDVIPGNVATPITPSELKELGAKFALLGDKLFFAVAGYRQTREAIDANTFESFSTQAQGIETELRFVPAKRLSISAAANWQKTIYLRAPTSFGVAPVFFGLSGADAYGGLLTVTNIPANAGFRERGGLPDKVISLFGTYTWTKGLGVTLGGVYTAAMTSGSARSFVLPSALVVNGSIFYATKKWEARIRVNNATDERYFQSNSPDNIGNTVAIQKPPRNYELIVGYKF